MAKFTRKRVTDPFEMLPERLRYPRISDWTNIYETDSDRTATDKALWEAYPEWKSAVVEHAGCTLDGFSAWAHEAVLGRPIWQYFAQSREFDTPMGEQK